MSPLELLAAALGLASVALTARQHMACWPTGIAMVVLYGFIFYEAKLYADMGLQVVYFFLQIYGWWSWARGGPQQTQRKVQRLGLVRAGIWATLGVLGGLGLGFMLHRNTDAASPYLDSQVTALSLVAQWLLSHKVLESWVFWIVVDVLAVYVFATRGLWPTTALYALFLGMASAGLLAWRRDLEAA